MAIELFEHNQNAYEAAETMLIERRKAAVVHPTGTGKSFIGFKLCETHASERICWLSPSRYIYQTQIENLKEVSEGYEPENVIFFTYAKLMLLSDEELAEIQPDFIILDEFHRCGAEFWGNGVQKLMQMYPEACILGLSATAIRYLDNQRNMTEELFDGNIASEMTLGEAIVRGILNPPKYILSVFSFQKEFEKYEEKIKKSKYRGIRDIATEYLEALRRSLDKAEKLDVIFDKHMENRTGKYIVFCANAEHMDDMIDKADEWFHKVDKKPHIYKAYSSDPETSKAFADFKADTSNHLKLLYCIDMLNEGVHVDDVAGVILLRPTVSPIIYKQQIGRALSASSSVTPIIFDIVNNIENLYNIDSVKEEMEISIKYFYQHDNDDTIVNEEFELIDKVADCKSLFELLEDTLSASWDVMYEYAKQYYEKFGNLEVPKNYFTEDGNSLGIWVATQRQSYRGNNRCKPLTQVQINKLNAIGMIWESMIDKQWNDMFDCLCEYHKEHQSWDISNDVKAKNGNSLKAWADRQRTSFSNETLSAERIEKLNSIGFPFETPDTWEEKFQVVKAYYDEHGNIDAPSRLSVNGCGIRRWLARQKKYEEQGKLTEKQIEKLTEIGLFEEVSHSEKVWENRYQLAKHYFEENGNLDMPHKTVYCGFQLGIWLSFQRKAKNNGELTQEQIDKLDALGMKWGSIAEIKNAEAYENGFQHLEKFLSEFGMEKLVAITVCSDGFKIGTWVTNCRQRYKNGELADEYIERFRELRVPLDDNDIWEYCYLEVKAYFEEHGVTCFTEKYIGDSGRDLSFWLSKQRRAYKKGELSQEQMAKLDAIGYPFTNDTGHRELYDRRWNECYERLLRFVEQNDRLPVFSKADKDERLIRTWIKNQQIAYKKGRLSEEQVEKLKIIGIEMNA